MQQPFVLVIYGPTGVGKSDIAHELAQQGPFEIVNMDMGQFYVPLTIGTAKPAWRSFSTPHHLFDIINEPKNCTVAEYRALVLPLIDDIWRRNKMPIVVGGSGFYLKSLLFPPRAGKLHGSVRDESTEQLWYELYQIDSIRATQIDKNDRYRIVRALDIWYETKQLPSSYQPQFAPPAPFFILFCTRDKEDLYSRINRRVVAMVEQGFVEEVRQLQGGPWQKFIEEKKIIGYPELFAYLASAPTMQRLDLAVRLIQQKSRHYAKRQLTFWKMLKKEVAQAMAQESTQPFDLIMQEINLTGVDHHLYIKQLLWRLIEKFERKL